MGKTLKVAADVEGLQSFCKSHLIQEKILLVEDHAQGNQALEALGRKQPCVNFRVQTVRDIVEEVAKSSDKMKNSTMISAEHGKHIMKEVLYQVQKEVQYFKDIQISYELAEMFYQVRLELKKQGLRTIPKGCLENTYKEEDLNLIFTNYERKLEQSSLVDEGELYKLAQDTDYEAWGNEKFAMIWGELSLTHLERKIVMTYLGYEGGSIELQETTSCFKAEQLTCFKGYGEYHELYEVLRMIKKEGIPFDEVAIYHTDATTYPRLMYELSLGVGVPVTFAQGISVSYTNPFKLLEAVYQWVESNYRANQVANIIKYLDVKALLKEKGIEEVGFSIPCFSKLKIGWGRERYNLALSKALSKEGLADYEKAQLEVIAASLEFLFEVLKEETTYGQLANDLKVLIKKCKKPYAEADEALNKKILALHQQGKESLYTCLNDISSMKQQVSLKEGLSYIVELAHQQCVAQSGAKPGHIYMTQHEKGLPIERKYHFIVGLDAERVPKTEKENPLLLDDERQCINKKGYNLTLSTDFYKEQLRKLDNLIYSRTGQLILSYPTCDLASGKEKTPAYKWIEYKADFKQHTQLETVDVADVKGFIPDSLEECLTIGDQYLYYLLKEKKHIPIDSVSQMYPWLKDLEEASRSKQSKQLTVYDGKIEDDESLLAPMCGKNPDAIEEEISASTLQNFAGCPYQYFLAHVLGIKKLEEVEYNPNQWLNAADKGSVLHEIFEKYYKALQVSNQDESELTIEVKKVLIQRIMVDVLEEWKERVSAPNTYSQAMQEKEIRKCCMTFVEREEENIKGRNPIAFEYTFGNIGDKKRRAALIELANEVYFKLHGKIDRIDQRGDNFSILDYKSSSNADGYKGKTKGEKLQHTLYSLAYEELEQDKGHKVDEAVYYFVSLKGTKSLEKIWQTIDMKTSSEDRAYGKFCLDIIFDMMKKGIFVRTCKEKSEEKGSCRYCDFISICKNHKDNALLKEKWENEKNIHKDGWPQGEEIAFYE